MTLFNRTGPDEHVEAVDKLQKSVKLLQKVRAFHRRVTQLFAAA